MKRSNVATRACTLAVAMVVTCAGLAVAGQNPAPFVHPALSYQVITQPTGSACMHREVWTREGRA